MRAVVTIAILASALAVTLTRSPAQAQGVNGTEAQALREEIRRLNERLDRLEQTGPPRVIPAAPAAPVAPAPPVTPAAAVTPAAPPAPAGAITAQVPAPTPGEKEADFRENILQVIGLPKPELGGARFTGFFVGSANFNSHSQIVPEFDERSRRLYATGGSGSHPSRNIALLRALLEAEQGRLTVIAGSRDDFSRKDYAVHRSRRVLDWFRSEICSTKCEAEFRDVPSFEGRTLNEDLDWLLERLRGAGIQEVVAVDLSKPELGIPVVRVIVPYLESLSFAPKYVPGRRARMQCGGSR